MACKRSHGWNALSQARVHPQSKLQNGSYLLWGHYSKEDGILGSILRDAYGAYC